jgi:hypothetical protein
MFHAGISDHGLHAMAFILTGLSAAILALTLVEWKRTDRNCVVKDHAVSAS